MNYSNNNGNMNIPIGGYSYNQPSNYSNSGLQQQNGFNLNQGFNSSQGFNNNNNYPNNNNNQNNQGYNMSFNPFDLLGKRMWSAFIINT